MVEIVNDIMVSIICCTYNQKSFIKDCLEGFVTQKTNFKFEAVVHDDASTDGTQDIIKEYEKQYPDIIKPIYEEENQYSKKNGSLERIVHEHCHGKYLAICEGDDYWIDSYKLQKQVDFLESHPDYSMVHTRFNYLFDKRGVIKSDEDNHRMICDILKTDPENIPFYILEDNRYRIQTMTVLYRVEALEDTDEIQKETGLFFMGDTQLWLNLLKNGKIYYMSDVTSFYRVNENSVSKSFDMKKHLRFSLSCEEMRYYYAKKMRLNPAHFYRRYIRSLYKYLAFEPYYISNERIIKWGEYDVMTKFLITFKIVRLFKCCKGLICKYEENRNLRENC